MSLFLLKYNANLGSMLFVHPVAMSSFNKLSQTYNLRL